MGTKLRLITRTAVLLALLVAFQAVTKPLGQLVTGSLVNTLLAVSALTVGLWGGLVVALVSPVLAFLLGIAPQILTVPAIMAGNALFVFLLWLLGRKGKMALPAVAVASVAKFLALYALVNFLICGVLAESLLSAGLLKAPMLLSMPATFSWPQLITALIGGSIGLLIWKIIKKSGV